MTKQRTPAQIKTRLTEIEAEQAELAAVDHDAILAKAIVAGDNLDALEEDQANAERRQRRLRIEHETLTSLLPEAERLEVQPKLDKMQKEHAGKIGDAAKSVEAALSHWEALQAEIKRFASLRNEAITLTTQARTLADSVGAPDPGLVMGPPLSRQLSAAGEYFRITGDGLQAWATLPMRNVADQTTYGINVDPRPAPLKGVA